MGMSIRLGPPKQRQSLINIKIDIDLHNLSFLNNLPEKK